MPCEVLEPTFLIQGIKYRQPIQWEEEKTNPQHLNKNSLTYRKGKDYIIRGGK